MAMKCQELLALLGDYVDGAIDPSLCEEFERHMQGCEACQVVVDTIRKTIRVYCEGREMPLPETFHQRLHNALRERWKQ
ncbi:MAG: hypothetical protein D6766_12070, partial [Verrucomicrobia bacterium]